MDTLREKMIAIRDLLDVDTKELAIPSLVAHGQDLAAMIGLSAEVKSEARRNLETTRLAALKGLNDNKVATSIIMKMADGACADQHAQLEYADRLNAGITRQLDFIRTVISLHKTELETSMKA